MKRLLLVVWLSILCGAVGSTQGTTLVGRYPEVSQLDISTAQDLGIQVAFKSAASQGFTKAASPGAFVAERIKALFQDAEVAHVTGEQLNRILEALKVRFSNDDVVTLNKVATDLGVDLTIDPNAK